VATKTSGKRLDPGAVKCALGVLYFDLGATRKARAEAARVYGEPQTFAQITTKYSEQDDDAFAILLWAGLLRHQPDITLEELDTLVTVANRYDLFLAVDAATSPFFYGPERAAELTKLRDKAIAESGGEIGKAMDALSGANPPPSESQETTPS